VDLTFNQQTRFPSLESGLLVDTIDPFNFTPGTYFDFPRATGPIADRRNTLITKAVFAENRLSLLDGLHLVTGLRLDDIHLDSDNLRAGTPIDHPEERSFTRDWRPVTWRVGLMYDITPDFNLYAQYSTAADPPAGILTTTNFRTIRDFGLTTGRQVEVGSKFDFWQDRGSATIAGFFLERQNLVTRDPLDPLVAVPIGAQSSRGVEVNAGLRVAPRWSVQGNMAWVDATFDAFNENIRVGGRQVAVSRAGNRPANVAEWVANTWLTWEFHPQARWMFATRYVGERFADPANTVPVAAYARFDTQLAWQAHPAATLTLRVLNLTDETFIEWATPTPMYLLGAPRTFEVAAWLRF
jgi:iron complex outermembrane receptor protein